MVVVVFGLSLIPYLKKYAPKNMTYNGGPLVFTMHLGCTLLKKHFLCKHLAVKVGQEKGT